MAAGITTRLTTLHDGSQAIASLKALEGQYLQFYGVVQAGSAAAQKVLIGLSAAFVGLGAGAFVAFNATRQFNEALVHVRALGDLTKQEMYSLGDSIGHAAAKFGVSGDVIAQGAVQLSKAGLSVAQINQGLAAMTMLSKANGIAFEEASKMTVFAIETFGKSYADTEDILDKMQVATQRSILDVGDLQKAFAYAGSTANMTGISFEQLISIMAVLSNRALEAGISARSVNKMFLDIIQHTDELEQFLKGMGMTFDIIEDGRINIDALVAAFENEKLTIEMLQGATDIFTVRALRSFGLLVGASADYEEMLNAVNNASGTLTEVTETQLESFNSQLAVMKEQFMAIFRTPEMMESVGIMVEKFTEFFSSIKPELAVAMAASLEGFASILGSEAFQEAFQRIVELFGKFMPLLGAVFNIIMMGDGALLNMAIGMKLASATMGGLMNSSMGLYASFSKNHMQIIENSLATRRWEESLISAKEGLNQLNIEVTENTTALELWDLLIKSGKADLETLEMVFQRVQEQFRLGPAYINQNNDALTLFGHNLQRVMHNAEAVGKVLTAMSGAMMAAYGAGIMLAMAEDNLSKSMFALIAITQILNSALAINSALEATRNWAKYGPIAAGAAALAMTGIIAGTYLSWENKLSKQKAELESERDKYIADTGMFVRGRRSVYDEGGVAPRHQLVYVEPGEQIISKTQGMVGMGTGVTVNVGDVYAQDGTDFAQKLANELPKALRMSSYRGAF